MYSNKLHRLSPLLILAVVAVLFMCGCGSKDNIAVEAPPPATVVPGLDVTHFSVDHPERYPVATAVQYEAPSKLVVTGSVYPDVSRTVPVVTLASGRVVDIRARLGDTVQKDQVLLRVRSDDVGMGFDAYRKAISDELLARKQLERTKDLYERPQSHAEHPPATLPELAVSMTASHGRRPFLLSPGRHRPAAAGDHAHPAPLPPRPRGGGLPSRHFADRHCCVPAPEQRGIRLPRWTIAFTDP